MTSEKTEIPFYFDLNDGEIVWRGRLTRGRISDGGWGVQELTFASRTPIDIAFLRAFVEAGTDGVEAALRPVLTELDGEEA